MRVELTEVHWLDRQHELSLAELCELSGCRRKTCRSW